MKKTRLIVFTGIDGSGKTTQANLLITNLRNNGIEALYVWARWKPFFVRFIINLWKKKETKSVKQPDREFYVLKDRKRNLLGNPVIMWLWLASFLIDYGIQIFIKIRVNLLRGRLVISDRVFYDSVIDQAINLGEKKEWLLENLDSAWMKLFFPDPDMVIYIDCPGDEAFSRKDDAPDVNYLEERRALYLRLAEKYKWVTIDGTKPVEELSQLIMSIVREKMKL